MKREVILSLTIVILVGVGKPTYAQMIAQIPQSQLQSQESKILPFDSVAIKEYLSQVIAERDRQYAQRFEAQQKAVDAALVAQDKATSAAFAAAKEAVAAALAAQERATNAAFTAANSAVTKAETANEKRLDSVNEFRAQLKDQAGNFVTRTELLTTIVGIGGLIVGFVTIFLHSRKINQI